MTSKPSSMCDVLAQYQQTKQRILSKAGDAKRTEPISRTSYALPEYFNPAVRSKSGGAVPVDNGTSRTPSVASPAFMHKPASGHAVFHQSANNFGQAYGKQEHYIRLADAPGLGSREANVLSRETGGFQRGESRRDEPKARRENEWPGQARDTADPGPPPPGANGRVTSVSTMPIGRASADYDRSIYGSGQDMDGGVARQVGRAPGRGYESDMACGRGYEANAAVERGYEVDGIGGRPRGYEHVRSGYGVHESDDRLDLPADMVGNRDDDADVAVTRARQHDQVESLCMTSLRCENDHLRDAFLEMKHQLHGALAHARQTAEEKAQLARALEDARAAAARQDEQHDALAAMPPPSPSYRDQATSLRVVLADREDQLRRAMSEVRRLESSLSASQRLFSEREAALTSQSGHIASLLDWAHGSLGRLRDAVEQYQQQLFPTFQPSQELIQWVAASAAKGGMHGLSLEGWTDGDSKSLARLGSSAAPPRTPPSAPDPHADGLISTMHQLERSLGLLCTVTDAKLEASALVAARLRAEAATLRTQTAEAHAERDAAREECGARAAAERSEREELGAELGVLKQLFDAEVARLKGTAEEAEQAAVAAREHAGGLEQRILQLDTRMLELQAELASTRAALESEVAARRDAEDALPLLESENQRLREELEGVQLAQKFGAGQKLHGKDLGRGNSTGFSVLGNGGCVQGGQGSDARSQDEEVRKLMRMVDALVKENTELQRQSRKWAEGAEKVDGARDGRESVPVKQAQVSLPLHQRQHQPLGHPSSAASAARDGVSGAELAMVADGTMSDSELMKTLLARRMLAASSAGK